MKKRWKLLIGGIVLIIGFFIILTFWTLFLIVVSSFETDTQKEFKPTTVSDLRNFPSEIDWDAVRSNDVAKTSEEWSEPKLHPVSSPGWEEGVYISGDGNELYYIYTDNDVFRSIFRFGYPQKRGPIIDQNKSSTHCLQPEPHPCGKWPRADHFFTTNLNGTWSYPKPHPLTQNGPIGGITLVGENKAYFMYGFFDEERDIEDIGYAIKENGVWGEKIKIEEVSSLEHTDSDPFVTKDDTEMFFWSERPSDEFAKKNIYRSTFENGKWSEPQLLPKEINSDEDDMMTFLFEGYLYFASARDDGMINIWKSERLGPNQWGEATVVIDANFATGEQSITDDGKYLYFEQIIHDGDGNFNPDIMYVERMS
jgi:hypothetical protein